jgi:hypothetical protein
MIEYFCCPPQQSPNLSESLQFQKEDYIILTPITKYKLYSLKRFLKNAINFQPPPREIVLCSEPDIRNEILCHWKKVASSQKINFTVLTLRQKDLLKAPPKTLERITISRNYLRNYFINSPYNWALWLDSDIFPERNAPKKLFKIALSEKYLAVTNYCPGRGEYLWAGIGCTLTHKAICKAIQFQCGSFVWNGRKVGWLSEDFCFLAILDRLDPFLQGWIGWKSRKIGTFVSLVHEISPGVKKKLSA